MYCRQGDHRVSMFDAPRPWEMAAIVEQHSAARAISGERPDTCSAETAEHSGRCCSLAPFPGHRWPKSVTAWPDRLVRPTGQRDRPPRRPPPAGQDWFLRRRRPEVQGRPVGDRSATPNRSACRLPPCVCSCLCCVHLISVPRPSSTRPVPVPAPTSRPLRPGPYARLPSPSPPPSATVS